MWRQYLDTFCLQCQHGRDLASQRSVVVGAGRPLGAWRQLIFSCQEETPHPVPAGEMLCAQVPKAACASCYPQDMFRTEVQMWRHFPGIEKPLGLLENSTVPKPVAIADLHLGRGAQLRNYLLDQLCVRRGITPINMLRAEEAVLARKHPVQARAVGSGQIDLGIAKCFQTSRDVEYGATVRAPAIDPLLQGCNPRKTVVRTAPCPDEIDPRVTVIWNLWPGCSGIQ